VGRSAARVETVIGDARVSLESELESFGSQQYDLLVVDAFRNDAVPIHLLTRECGVLYFRHLKEDGALLLHISNRFVDLEPVVRGLAATHNVPVLRVQAGSEPERGAISATWMVATTNEGLRQRLAAAGETPNVEATGRVLWTDDFSALWPVIRKTPK
jgi:spermidine synthase